MRGTTRSRLSTHRAATRVGSVWRWVPALVTSGFVMAGFVKDTGFLAAFPSI